MFQAQTSYLSKNTATHIYFFKHKILVTILITYLHTMIFTTTYMLVNLFRNFKLKYEVSKIVSGPQGKGNFVKSDTITLKNHHRTYDKNHNLVSAPRPSINILYQWSSHFRQRIILFQPRMKIIISCILSDPNPFAFAFAINEK